MQEQLDPLAAPAETEIQVLSTVVHIKKLSIERSGIVAYLQNIPADKVAIALVHALEVGITELAARRQRFGH